ncbi:MAG TPA: iron-sulfur cluster assembly scaffold protein [Candidatus Nanoarchaeia archaeon]|nr:iron-sulfur cluster assembly scaffold protein [Candidatus Nanoarchaeia archaeon]
MTHEFSDNMYKEYILELYKSPENYGEIQSPSHEHTETNASCGDEITMQLLIKDGKIVNAKFHGSGCVMSIVSSSMLTSKIKGMPVEDVKNLERENVLEMFNIKINPGRLKCVLLPLFAVKNSLK